jgi:hypothetical protein
MLWIIGYLVVTCLMLISFRVLPKWRDHVVEHSEPFVPADIESGVSILLFVSVLWGFYIVIGLFIGIVLVVDDLWSFVHAKLSEFLFPAPKKNENSYEVLESGHGGTTTEWGEPPGPPKE